MIDRKCTNINKLIDFALITLKFKLVSITKSISLMLILEFSSEKKIDELAKVQLKESIEIQSNISSIGVCEMIQVYMSVAQFVFANSHRSYQSFLANTRLLF